MFDGIIKLIGPGLLVGVVLGVFGGYAWNHRPDNWPNLAVGPCPFCVHLGTGIGLASKARATQQWIDAYKTEAKSLGICTSAMDRQEMAVERLTAQSKAWQAQGQAAMAAAAAASQSRLALAARLRAVQAPPGADELTRCRVADQVLLEGAQ